VIQAISFDLWDTLVVDDSDEAVRAERGLLPKPAARQAAFLAEVHAHHPGLDRAQVLQALAQANAWFTRCWKEEHHTPALTERLAHAFALLGLANTPGFDRLVRRFAEMEVEVPPRLVPNIRPTLEALHGRHKLGIISDAIVTPGADLRRILEGHGIRHFFDVFIFSDEAGASKPHRDVFAQAVAAFGVAPSALVHIGDREANDVAGPQAFGSRAILYTGAIDRGSARSRADAICTDHAELPGLIDALCKGEIDGGEP
jgi:HAD superfamily hydrolase (TIGR01549 family)